VPTNGDVGSVALRVTATDAAGANVSADFALGVANVNDAPVVANPIAAQTAAEDSPFAVTLPASAFADDDAIHGDTLTYSASLADGSALPPWLSFDPASRTFSGTPANADVGSLSLRVTATDMSGASVFNDFTLSVANTNDAPVTVSAISAQTVSEDSPFAFTVPAGAFHDDDVIHGDRLSYSAVLANGSALPAWLTFDAATQTFSGTPANGDVGAITVRLTATDTSAAAASQDFAITVANTNDTPVVAGAIADQSTNEDSAFTFTLPAGAFADDDAIHGDTLSYAATLADGGALPTWLSFDAATRSFSGTPVQADVGALDVRVTATDQPGAAVSDLFTLTVVNVNDAPVVSAGLANQTVTEYSPFTYQVPLNTFTDEDPGETLTYSATLADGSALPGWLSIDGATRTLSGSPTYTERGQFDVRVTATDAAGAQASTTFALAVQPLASSTAVTLGSDAADRLGGGREADLLVGAAGDDTLRGHGGDDILDGGAGNDDLDGAKGNDTYIFGRGDGQDRVRDHDNTAGNRDTVQLGVNAQDVLFSRTGNDLILSLHGSAESLTIENWYKDESYHTEVIQAADGSTLLDTQVEQLIQAMAQFSAGHGGISWDQAIDQNASEVQAVLAAYWQPGA
jgi:Ca2+-binding RTX toxin-like protein